MSPSIREDETKSSIVPHILIADDHLDTLDMMAQFLARSSFNTISVATTVQEAMKVAAARPPDLLVTDLYFPDGDGCLLLLELRRNGNPAIKGIAVTGDGTQANRETCRRAEFDAFLLKPVELSSIAAAVKAALSTVLQK